MHNALSPLRAFLPCAALLASLVGCGGTVTTGGGGGGSTPAEPASIALSLTPKKPYYAPNTKVAVAVDVKDAAGAPLAAPSVRWTVSPVTAAHTDAGATAPAVFELLEQGLVTLRGCVGPEAAPLCDEVGVVVETEPSLTVTTPLPGAELGSDGATSIHVEGQVTAHAPAHVFVNGAVVAIGSDGRFTAEVAPQLGVTALEIAATDGLYPTRTVAFDVLWAPAYAKAVDASGAPSVTVPSGVLLQLGRDFFDDGASPPNLALRPVTTRSVAGLLELVLLAADLGAQLPDPLLSMPGSTPSEGVLFRATSARVRKVDVEVNLAPGGLDAFTRVSELTVTTTGHVSFGGQTVSLDGEVIVRAAIDLGMALAKAEGDAAMKLTLGDVGVVIEGMEGHFTDPAANAIFSVAGGNLRSTMVELVRPTLQSYLQQYLPSAIEGVLGAIDGALSGTELDLGKAPLPPLKLRVGGKLRTLDVTPTFGARAALSVSASTDKTAAVHPTSLGAMLTTTAGASDALFAQAPIQLGVDLAVMNGILHALWNSGMLEITLSALQPLEVSGKLPPIVRAPRPDERHDLVLSLGELQLTPMGSKPLGRFGVGLDAGIDLGLLNGKLTFTVADKPVVRVWTEEPPPAGALIDAEGMRSLLLDFVWPELRGAIADGLAFELPLPSLEPLTALAPSLSGLTLTVSQRRPLAVRSGLVLLDVGWEAKLP